MTSVVKLWLTYRMESTTTITTLGEWTYAGESHEILAVACPISTRPEYNDGTDLELLCRVRVVDTDFMVHTDKFEVPHVAALWEAV